MKGDKNMSLPDNPNTLRETYYSVMAGQNDASILPDIETAPSTENRYLDYIARNGGGGGGDVTKEYVDTAIANAVADKVDKVEGKGLSTNDYTNADKALVQGSPITTTSTTSPITDSADGYVQGITIYGRSEVVEGEIKSVGDDGLTVTTANSDNTLTTSAEFTTALPFRGVSDTVRDKLTCTAESKQVETVCGKVKLADLTWTSDYNAGGFSAVIANSPSGIIALICSKYPYDNSVTFYWSNFNTYDNKTLYRSFGKAIYIKDTDYTTVSDFVASLGDAELVYELAEPVTTPLTTAEISAFRGLKTYDSTTNITITDNPEFEIDYLKNTENGQTVAGIHTDLQRQIDDKVTVSPLLTLTVAGWNSTTLQQTVTFVHDTTKRNVIDVDPASVEEWAACGIIARYETANDITFICKSIPENALLFKVTSMGV